MSGSDEMDPQPSAGDLPAEPAAPGLQGKPPTKKQRRKELVWRRPKGMKFDVTATDRVDEATWQLLESLCPNRRVLLQYSTGKDSCAAWLALRERGFEVVPLFKEIFRGLSFFERPIAAHEKFFGTEVHIVPNKLMMFDTINFYNDQIDLAKFGLDLKDKVAFQAKSKSYRTRYNNLFVDKMLEEFRCDVCVIGTKASDSLHRRTHFKVDGPYLPRERLFSLVWRLKKSAPFQMMIEAGMPIPSYYLCMGRSPEFNLPHEMSFIKRFYPEDYEVLRALLKGLDAYVARYEENNEMMHVIKPPSILVEAKVKGTAVFV